MTNTDDKQPADEIQPASQEIADTELDEVAGGSRSDGDINPQPLPPGHRSMQ